MKQILFNTDMVRAILDERKTVTRRAVKPQPKNQLVRAPISSCYDGDFTEIGMPVMIKPPYQPGDILYVREPWQYMGSVSLDSRIADRYIYRVDWSGEQPLGWRPSIHMPKAAARIFLWVTDVKVERLQQITEEQAEAEGCQAYANWEGSMVPAIVRFSDVWNSTIKPADRALYGWNANPWVWVIEFEWISKAEAQKNEKCD